MKRRVISFLTVLALCLSLCPIRVLAASDEDLGPADTYYLQKDFTGTATYVIAGSVEFDTKGYSYTISGQTAVRVQSTGKLYLTHGTIESTNGAGIEILTGGFLRVENPGMTVIGTTYGLDFSSGTTARLSGGTFKGAKGAIQAADGNYSALLKAGHAYFDENGDPLRPDEVSGMKTVTVKECTDHVYDYTANTGTPTQDGICIYCGSAVFSVRCTFQFDEDGSATCDECGHTIQITITPEGNSFVYDGTDKTESVGVKVVLDGDELTKDTDYNYTVEPSSLTDVGEFTVTVTGVTYIGTFAKTFCITQAQPVITWQSTDPITVNYDGNPVDENVFLPKVNITPNDEDLKKLLYFSYKEKDTDADFTAGLPTDAGTYEIKANLPEQTNYKAASSSPITLTIKPIDPIIDAPKPVENLVYNRGAQELVTHGKVWDGAVILFATSEDGPWTTAIPTGTDAGNYTVYYKVEGNNNYDYTDTAGTLAVTIQRKPITPDVTLEYTSYVYTGGAIEPKVTVRDPDGWTELLDSEYKVAYSNNINVGGPGKGDNPPTVTVTDKDGGNYAITKVETYFDITEKDQAGLTITGQPGAVSYGDVFVLGTSGGSGNGTVTWAIVSGDSARIDQASGQVTVTGIGTVTVRATRSGADYKDATAEWTFTSAGKHVTATVTADNQTYNGNVNTTVHAVVPEQDIVSGDTIMISGLSGTFSDANAGTGKTVTVTGTADITGTGSEKYIVTIPKTATADITRAETTIITDPTVTALTYNGADQALITAATASTTTGVTVEAEYALSVGGPYSTYIPKAADAGSYQVWYRVAETDNYFGTTAKKVDVTISAKTVSNLDVTLTQETYVYDGTEKKPSVTVKDGNTEIPSSEYTVEYSNNINAGNATDANAPTVAITAKSGGNYTFTKTVNFTINKADAVLTATPQAVNSLVYNGQAQNLVTVGTAMGGHLEYSLTGNNDYNSTIPQGTGAKTYTVYYKVVGDSNHNGIDTPSVVYVTIQPKTVVSPVITLTGESGGQPYSVMYTGQEQKPPVASVADGTDTIPSSEYTVTYSDNINAGTATVHINNANGGNYIVNGSTTFTITKATAKFTTAPTAKALTYNGKPQPLITAGVPDGGTAVYWLEDESYSAAIPTGTDQGTYKIFAQVLGDANHVDSDPVGPFSVTITPKPVSPIITCSPSIFPYDGTEKTPNVIVTDGDDEIPSSEYTVTFSPSPRISTGTYTVTVTAKSGGNYTFAAAGTGSFEIKPADQAPLSIVTDKAPTVYYGDTFRLSAVGGSGTGAVKWSVESTPAGVADITEDGGVVTVKGVGSFTVTAYREGTDGSYGESNTDSMTFEAKAKPVTAVVTAANKVYDGTDEATLSVTVPGTNITVVFKNNYKGTFDSADVGTNKTVTFAITENDVTVTGDGNYAITYPITGTTTASITPAPTSLNGIIVTANNSTYNRTPQALVTAALSGITAVDGGDLAYSLDGRNYTLVIPKETNADTYTVWYKVLADSNHKDSEVRSVEVTIGKAMPEVVSAPIAEYPITTEQLLKECVLTGGRVMFDGVEVPGTFTWTNGNAKLSAGRASQGVTFTPTDGINYETVAAEVEVTVIYEAPSADNTGGDNGTETPSSTAPDSGTATPPSAYPGTESASTQTTVRDGTASTVVNAAAGNKLVDEAVANQSENVIIKPEITGNVTKAEISIPASAVSRLGNETDAALTVSTPIADVTIPNGALSTLSGAGGTVIIVTEQVGNTVVLTLTANGKDVGNLPGGLTLTVPVDSAGPGTVAVLVYADGTRETVRKSVAGGEGVRIPLNGSAIVEIVDNSKKFADVSAENWAFDAVAFASAHEMFNGTGEMTFSPELSMSRAMLATVLYNLESNPETAFNGAFADVGGNTWYAESVSWAANRGIVTGYGNGSFGANDSITREQLAVMLWRYAGSPTADKQALNFTDANQASSYAVEALRWAAANGILNGYGNGRLDPAGLATRAQAAQMLKNFMENT